MGMFDQAKAIPAAQPPKPKGKAKAELPLAGVEHLAMVDALEKALEGIRTGLEAQVKGAALTHFVEEICSTGRKPESFKATDGGASATLTLSKRGANIALNEGQVEALRQIGVEPEKAVMVPKLFGINPAYAENAELLSKVETAIAGIVPADFIVMQQEQSKSTVSDVVLEKALAAMKGKPEVAATVLSSLVTLSCKPKLVNTNLHTILEFVRGFLSEPAFGEAAQEAKVVKLQVVGKAA